MGGKIGQDSLLTHGLALAAVPFAMIGLAIAIGGFAESRLGRRPLPWRIATFCVNTVLLASLMAIGLLDHMARDWTTADLILVTGLPLVTTGLAMAALILLLPKPPGGAR